MKRLFFSIVFAVLGSLFLITWGLDKLVESNTEKKDSQDIILYKKLIEGISRELNPLPSQQINDRVNQLSRYYDIEIILEQTTNVALPPSLNNQLLNQGGLLLASRNAPYLIKGLNQHENTLIKMYLPTDNTEHKTEHIDIILTAILYLGVCSIIIIWLFPLTRRLFKLTTVAEKIGEGHLNLRIKPSRYSYIKSFENSFNLMAAKIEKLVNDNQILARSLSHDIRTPMSCLRFGIEAAFEANSLDNKNKYIQRMETELTRMEEMTTVFLEYAGMERKGFNLKKETVNVHDFLQHLTDEFQSLAQQYNIALTYQNEPQSVYFIIDEYWCKRAIQNLVSNAVQYANKKVRIALLVNSTDINISVEDDGKGLPQDKLTTIFDPFVKLDQSRKREDGHFGLGLAICEKVMDWHSGNITAHHSSSLSGAKFSLIFPIKK